MKKIKILTIALLSVFLLTGCFKRDNLDDITIYTTTYPIEYLTKYIYGYNSNVLSIYPKGTNPREYTLTDKKIKEYANSDMLIYNGETKEKNIAASFMNKNKHLKIIDVSKGLTVKRDEEELWLCPSNYLMLAQNIKNELLEYTSSTLLKQEINDNYDKLKLIISSYDAELKVIAESSSNPTIVAANDVFKFLEKYGFKVLSIEENDLANPAELNEAKNNIKNKKRPRFKSAGLVLFYAFFFRLENFSLVNLISLDNGLYKSTTATDKSRHLMKLNSTAQYHTVR